MGNELKKYLDATADDIAKSLQGAALEYFNLGIRLYEKTRKGRFAGLQVVLGNLSISCELLLKAIVARKIFSCLYSNLSKEALAMLNYPLSMPKGTTPNSFIGDLRNFTERVIDIQQATSYFYQLYPKNKQEFKPHLSLLAPIRNTAVHAAVPGFQKYHLERIAYIACKLFKLAKDEGMFDREISTFQESQIDNIIMQYNEERINKVHKAIEAARLKSKSLNSIPSSIGNFDKWEMRVERCPACQNEAFCYGYVEAFRESEFGVQHDSGYDNVAVLFFYKERFKCENCELTLDDVEELNLAKIKISKNLEEEIEEWSQHEEWSQYGEFE